MPFGLKDDRDTAAPGDRLIAGVIGGFCGFGLGTLVEALVALALGQGFGARWLVAGGFGAYAFLAPTQSTELWSAIWERILQAWQRLTGRPL